MEKYRPFSIESIETQGEETELTAVYSGSVLFEYISQQKAENGEATALFTDIDHTFMRAGKEAQAAELYKTANEKNYPVISVTGNDYQSIINRVEKGELPPFQAIAGSVGTEIWVLQKGTPPTYKKDLFYESLLEKTGFDRPRLAREAKAMLVEFLKEHPTWQMNFQIPDKEKALEIEPEPDYQKFKISFHFFSSPEELETVSQKVSKFFPNQNILVCEEIGHNRNLPADAPIKKYCLDVLPATKADAVNYIGKICGIGKGMVAGDSGNDTTMLLDSKKLTAVLVGGYKNELKSVVDSRVSSPKPGKRSFQKIIITDGATKAIYIEQGERLAAESILHAAKILERAENISKLKTK